MGIGDTNVPSVSLATMQYPALRTSGNRNIENITIVGF